MMNLCQLAPRLVALPLGYLSSDPDEALGGMLRHMNEKIATGRDDRFEGGRVEELERQRRNGMLVVDGQVLEWPRGPHGSEAAWPIPFCYFRLCGQFGRVMALDGLEPVVREFFYARSCAAAESDFWRRRDEQRHS